MRYWIGVLAGVALLSGCGSADDERAADNRAMPNVSPTAAPGVAFQYAYDFLLSDDRISTAQERHASRCESLGVARCRITGLRYSVGDNEQVSAMLEVKLAPSIARQFGKAVTDDVSGTGGKLVNAEFTGEDVGSAVTQAENHMAEAKRRIADLQSRIAAAQPGSDERTELQRQLSALQGSAGEQKAIIDSGARRLASTPMTFNYYGRGGIPGFGNENPVREAARLAVASFVTMVSVVLKVVGVALPWAVLILLLVMLWRSRPIMAARRWWRSRSDQHELESREKL